jgi:hypothetical protein
MVRRLSLASLDSGAESRVDGAPALAATYDMSVVDPRSRRWYVKGIRASTQPVPASALMPTEGINDARIDHRRCGPAGGDQHPGSGHIPTDPFQFAASRDSGHRNSLRRISRKTETDNGDEYR